MPDHAIERRFDEIVRLAGVGSRVNEGTDSVPRRMLQRVAFAAATSASADLYAFDRMALVGDREYHEQCKQRLAELKAAGHGIVIYRRIRRMFGKWATAGSCWTGRTRTTDPDTLAKLLIDVRRVG